MAGLNGLKKKVEISPEDQLAEVFISGAEKRVRALETKEKKFKEQSSKPCFNRECATLRAEYFRAKYRLRRVKSDEVRQQFKQQAGR